MNHPSTSSSFEIPLSRKSTQLPRILSSNVRSALNKLDDINLTLSSLPIDIFAATETWFHKNIDDNVVKLPNYYHFRKDRNSRIGGGVCVWIRNSLFASCLQPIDPPAYMESVWLCFPLIKLLLACLYIPPTQAISKQSEIDDFLINNFDSFLNRFPDFDIAVCGDMNKFNVRNLEINFDMLNLVASPTRGFAILDYFIVSSSRSSDFKVTITAPIANADHKSVLAEPVTAYEPKVRIVKPLFDLRESNISNFLAMVSKINWAPLYLSSKTLDEKCSFSMKLCSTLCRFAFQSTHVRGNVRE